MPLPRLLRAEVGSQRQILLPFDSMKLVQGAGSPGGVPPGWERGERRTPAGGESVRGSAGTLTGGAWPGSGAKGRNSGAT